MKTRTLGCGLEVSALGLGCMGLDFGYAAKVTKAEGFALLRNALEHFGVRLNREGFPRTVCRDSNCMLERGGQRAWLNTFPLIFASG